MSDTSPLPSGSDAVQVGKRTAQGSGLVVMARLLTRLIDLFTMLTLTRLLVPADFGLVAIAMSLVSVTEAALEMPINQALLRLSHISRAHYDTAFTIGLLRGLVLCIIFLISAHPFATLYHDERLVWLVVSLGFAPMFRGLTSPKLAEFQKKFSFWRDFAIEIVGKLIAFVTCTGVAVLTDSYWAIAIGTIVYPIAMAACSYYLAPYRPRLSLAEVNAFYDFVGWASAGSIIGSFSWQFDRLLLGKVQTAAKLGLFTAASDLSNIPFSALFSPMIRPLLSAFNHLKADPTRLADSYQRSSSAIVSIGLPLLVGVSLLAEPIVSVVLGDHWIDAAPLVRWLSLTWVPALFAVPVVPLLMAFGETKTLFYRSLFELSIKLPIAVIGVFTFGFMGVVFARFVSELLADVLCLVIVRRILGLSIWQQLVVCSRAVLATLAMVLAIVPLLSVLPPANGFPNALLTIVATASAGSLVYVSVLVTAWMVSHRPDGLERMVWDFMMGRLTRLGNPPTATS